MSTPKRIQRKRNAGWKIPPNTVYVGRPTKWGNPYRVGVDVPGRLDATKRYRDMIGQNIWTWPTEQDIQKELRGKNLACWCPLDQPCHADVLMEIANK